MSEAAVSPERFFRFHPVGGSAYATEADKGGDGVLSVSAALPGAMEQNFPEWERETKATAVLVRSRGVEVWWRAGAAVVQCEVEAAGVLTDGVVEFAAREASLRTLEGEIAEAWGELEEDRRLAYDATPADLRRSERTGERMARAFSRRMRFARLAPHLHAADAALPQAAQKLGDELRERTRLEARAEAVDAQLEVFEHIYEMASQRLGEYRAAREGHRTEVIIIWLLAFEALLMVAQVVFRWRV